MKILAIIPARGGSKSIPNKNIIDLAGKHLISYSIEQALQIKHINKVVVSSDSDKILSVARNYGAETIKRPKKLATDTAKLDGTIRHVLQELENQSYFPDLIILLQPTSPLRKLATIRRAIKYFVNNIDKYDSLMPLYQLDAKIGRDVQGFYKPIYKLNMQRQEMDILYKECGTIFIFKPNIVKRNSLYGKYVYPFIIKNIEESIDIDSFGDLDQAEFYLDKKYERSNNKK